MSNRFDRLALLETFIRIAERRSLSAAARDLGTSQPSVSRQLAALETRLGTVLARRTTHEVALTADGFALLSDARRMVAEWATIEDRTARDGPLSGAIRVIAPVALGQSQLIRAASRFMNDHPGVSVDWHLRDDQIRFSEEGCDCWIKIGPVPDDTLVVRELARVERLVVGTAELHDTHRGRAIREMPWLALGPFEGHQIELFDGNGHAERFSVIPRMSTDNIFAVHEAVRSSVGVAILPRWLVADELRTGRLVDIAPDRRAASLPINLALAAGTRRPARVDRFSEAMADWFYSEFRTAS